MNPAAELLAIFKSWGYEGRETLMSSRRLQGPEVDASLREHVRAMQLIGEVHRLLDEWEPERDVTAYRAAVHAWTRYVIAFPQNWQAQGSALDAWRNAKIDMLEAMTITLGFAAPAIPAGRLDDFGGFLDEVLDLLAHDPDLTSELRGYLFHLVNEIRSVVDEFRTVGRFSHPEAFARLWVALHAARAQSKQPTKWEKFADRVLIPITVQTVAGIPALTMQAVLAITAANS